MGLNVTEFTGRCWIDTRVAIVDYKTFTVEKGTKDEVLAQALAYEINMYLEHRVPKEILKKEVKSFGIFDGILVVEVQ